MHLAFAEFQSNSGPPGKELLVKTTPTVEGLPGDS